MKLLVWDRGWNGATIVTTATPEYFIEEWRKAENDFSVKMSEDHDSKKYTHNPWPKLIDNSKDIESFMNSQNIKIYDIEEGLEIETEGD